MYHLFYPDKTLPYLSFVPVASSLFALSVPFFTTFQNQTDSPPPPLSFWLSYLWISFFWQFRARTHETSMKRKSPLKMELLDQGELLLSLFVFAAGDWRLKVYTLFSAASYFLGNNSSPLRELVWFTQISLHYYYLHIPFDFPSIIRHTLTRTICDLKRSQHPHQITAPHHPQYRYLYAAICLFFSLFGAVPTYSMFAYLVTAISFDSHCGFLWWVNYFVDLYFRSHIQYNYQ